MPDVWENTRSPQAGVRRAVDGGGPGGGHGRPAVPMSVAGEMGPGKALLRGAQPRTLLGGHGSRGTGAETRAVILRRAGRRARAAVTVASGRPSAPRVRAEEPHAVIPQRNGG
ncbi:hypothetical protein [Streptomyces pratensis]|uniref:hypothetical protein n=1 Tax=Streptomyces pratensis TaxID=1169025 RepID=UPI0030163E3C